MSLNRKFIFEDSWVRNMFSRSNMDFCMAEIKSEGVNESEQKVQIGGLLGQKMFSRPNTDFYMADVTSEGFNEYI